MENDEGTAVLKGILICILAALMSFFIVDTAYDPCPDAVALLDPGIRVMDCQEMPMEFDGCKLITDRGFIIYYDDMLFWEAPSPGADNNTPENKK